MRGDTVTGVKNASIRGPSPWALCCSKCSRFLLNGSESMDPGNSVQIRPSTPLSILNTDAAGTQKYKRTVTVATFSAANGTTTMTMMMMMRDEEEEEKEDEEFL